MSATKDLVLRTLPRPDEAEEERRLDRLDVAEADDSPAEAAHDPDLVDAIADIHRRVLTPPQHPGSDNLVQAPLLLSIPSDHRPLTMRVNGMEVAVLTWAAIPRAKADAPAALLHLSAIGPYAQLKAVWAHLLHVPARIVALPLAADCRETLRASRLSPIHGRYRTHWNTAPLPSSGQSHLSITHDVALDTGAGSGVALLQPLGQPLDTSLIVALLDRRLALPLPHALTEPAAARQLWANALTVGAVTPLPAVGCQAFWLATEHPAWPHLIVAALRGQPLDTIPSPLVTIHGSAHTIAVAITAVDDEDTERDSADPE